MVECLVVHVNDIATNLMKGEPQEKVTLDSGIEMDVLMFGGLVFGCPDAAEKMSGCRNVEATVS
jgi:hypothetical protein